MMGSRTIRDFIDAKGVPCKAVSLGNASGLEAVIDERSFDFLFQLGLSTAWRLKDGYVAAKQGKTYVSVARVLLGAGPMTLVRYVNKNPLDLRRTNLSLEDGHGTRLDRSLVKPKPERIMSAQREALGETMT